jgi:hypothetical protein
MAADDKGEEKPKKISEPREIIGTVKQIQDEGKTLTLKLEESDGSTWGWRTFHASEIRGKVEFDKTYKFGVTLVHEDGRQYPWRNLTKLIGPAEMPASGEFTSRPGAKPVNGSAPHVASGGGGVRSMDQSILTRNSIEAGNAINMVIELMKLGITVEDMPAAIEDLTANADKLVDWLSGHWVDVAPPNMTPATPATNGAAKPAKTGGNMPQAVEHPANPGELLNTCMVKWSLTKKDVEAIVESDIGDITDFDEALKRVGFEMQRGDAAPTAAA